MKPTETWYLIADGTRARVMARTGRNGSMRVALDHEFIAANIPDHDLGTDRPGRSRTGPGSVGHAYAATADWRAEEKNKFARELAALVEKGYRDKDFNELVLVASPQVLGALRHALKGDVAAAAVAEVAKDLTHLSVHDLPGHIEGAMA